MIGCGDDMFKPLPLAQIELIAVDLDGTLLRRDSSLSGKSLEAVRQAKKKGIRIIVASARPPRRTSCGTCA